MIKSIICTIAIGLLICSIGIAIVVRCLVKTIPDLPDLKKKRENVK